MHPIVEDITRQLIAILVVIVALYIGYLILKPHLFKRMRLTDIRICPKCGSTDIKTITSDDKQVGVIMEGTPAISRCKTCKHEGVFPIIHEDDVQAFQKIIAEEKHEAEKKKREQPRAKKKTTKKK